MQFDHLKRRDFIAFLGGMARWPLGPRAQPPARPVTGYSEPGPPDARRGVVRILSGCLLLSGAMAMPAAAQNAPG